MARDSERRRGRGLSRQRSRTDTDTGGEPERVSLIEEDRRQLKRRLELQELVQGFSSRMRSERDVGQIARILTEAVSTLTGFRNAMILLLEEDGETLQGLQISGHKRTMEIGMRLANISMPRIRLKLDEHKAYSQALRDGEIIFHRKREDIVNTLEALMNVNPGILEIIRRTTRLNLGITVPLFVGEREMGIVPLGIMGISSTKTEVDPEEMRVIQILADQASLAIHNAQLFNRLLTQMVRAESSEARLRRFIDNAHDIICVVDNNGKVTFANKAFMESGLYSPEEILGQETVDRLHPKDQTAVAQAFLELFEGQPVHGVEYRIKDEAGDYLWHNLNAAPLLGEEATSQETVCFIRDVTLKKKREQQVIRRNRELEVLNNLITNLSTTLDHDEVISLSLGIIADFTGADYIGLYTFMDAEAEGPLKLIGHLWLPEEMKEKLDVLTEHVGIEGFPSREEVAILEDLEALPPELYAIALRLDVKTVFTVPIYNRGVILGYVLAATTTPLEVDDENLAILRAVGDQLGVALETSRLFREVDQKSKELERRRREAEFYLDLMGHDISNLNQGALTSLEIMKASGSFGEKQRELVESAFTQVRASAALIEKVQTLSSLKMEQAEQLLQPADLVKTVRATTEIVRGFFPELEITMDLDAPQEPVLVLADRLIDQLVQNLLQNAVKFSRAEHPRVDIRIAPAKLDGEEAWELSIEDRGIGIPDHRKRTIFDRFETGLRDARSTGLGLTIVKAITERYGGRVWVEDRVKGDYRRGSTFKVLLKRADVPG